MSSAKSFLLDQGLTGYCCLSQEEQETCPNCIQYMVGKLSSLAARADTNMPKVSIPFNQQRSSVVCYSGTDASLRSALGLFTTQRLPDHLLHHIISRGDSPTKMASRPSPGCPSSADGSCPMVSAVLSTPHCHPRFSSFCPLVL